MKSWCFVFGCFRDLIWNIKLVLISIKLCNYQASIGLILFNILEIWCQILEFIVADYFENTWVKFVFLITLIQSLH